MHKQPDSGVSEAEMEELRVVIRKAGAERIAPLAAQVDASQQFSSELWTLLADLGVAALPFPTDDGGVGGTFAQFVEAIDEIAFFGACAALYLGPTIQVASAILTHGTVEQRERWARPLIADGKVGAWSFTEPETGSDPKAIRTVARRAGDGWLINGSKMFTSFAPYADTALLFAQTAPDQLGAFLIDTSNPGWQPGRPIEMLSFGGQGTAPVSVVDLRVGGDALLGRVDQGFDILIGGEAEAKVRASAICGGIGRRALLEATRYASERTHRGTPIGRKFPTVQATLGTMSANVDAARCLTRRAAEAVDAQEPNVSQLAASARIIASRMAREVSNDAMQVCGAYGFTKDMVLERLYREGKFYEVGQGVIELQRLIVGKRRLAQFNDAGTLVDVVTPLARTSS